MKRIIVFLFITIFITTLTAQIYQPRVAIKKLEYQGIGDAEANSILQSITKAMQDWSDFIVVKDIVDSEFYIFGTLHKTGDIFNLNLTFFDTKTNQAVENIIKQNLKKSEIEPIVLDGFKALMDNISKIDNYLAENQVYFYGVDPTLLNDESDVISRVKTETVSARNITSIQPVTENVFKRYPLSVSGTIAVAMPINLLNQEVKNSLFMDATGEYTFFTTSIIMLSAYVGSNYFFLEKPTSDATSNILHVLALDTGIGICYPVPFFRQVSLHLNGGGGYGISFINSIQYTDSIPISGDFFVNGFFEIRYALINQISINLNTSYKLVFYLDGLLHNLQIGGGVTYRIGTL